MLRRHATSRADMLTMPCDIDNEHVEVMVGNEVHVFTCDNRSSLVDCSEDNWNYALFACLYTILLDLEEYVEIMG